MPTEAPVAPAPSAPAAAPSTAAAPAPAQSTPSPSIHVTESSVVDKGPAPEPPKRGSAKSRLFADLRKAAGVEPEETAPQPEAKTQEPEKNEPESETKSETTPAAEPEKKSGKVSPWKLVDEHKAARVKAEQEIESLRKSMVEPAKVKEWEEKYSAAEKRLQELEQEIKFVNYRKSQEFQEKYEVPYRQAWDKAMNELGELTVQDPVSGQERPLEPKDILQLVNMDLRTARAKAVELYGDFADDVMDHRKEIRSLFEAQHKALEDARKGGAEREAQRNKMLQEQADALRTEITGIWNESNQQAVGDEKFGKYFKPVEGDEEANTRLAKGYEMADLAFARTPLDPNLTKEQRAEVVRLHAAVRNRSAAFGKLVYQNSQLESKIAALTEELNKFKNAQPSGGEARGTKPTGHTSARDAIFADLRAMAH